MSRKSLVNKVNSIVRKHKRKHNRRKELSPAPERPGLPAQVGTSTIGAPVSA